MSILSLVLGGEYGWGRRMLGVYSSGVGGSGGGRGDGENGLFNFTVAGLNSLFPSHCGLFCLSPVSLV